MKKRKTIMRMLIRSFKLAGADKVFSAYLVWFLVSALVIWLVESHITTYGDSLWYCFASATSIGFGDLTALTVLGRIVTVILSIYSIAVTAIFTAVIVNFFSDVARFRAQNTASKFIDDLEHLEELSPEELADLAKRVRDFLRQE